MIDAPDLQFLAIEWQCSECAFFSESEASAITCCDRYAIPGYACPVCRNFYECLDTDPAQAEQDARACCGWGDAPAPVSWERYTEARDALEKAGQLALWL